LKITGIIWLRSVINKLAQKHQVDQTEVEEVRAKTNSRSLRNP